MINSKIKAEEDSFLKMHLANKLNKNKNSIIFNNIIQ